MISYSDNIGLIHLITKKLFGWTQSLNLPMEYDDVFQEVSLAFVTAAAGYDDSLGIKFSAYLNRAAHNQIRKTVGVMTGLKRLNDGEKEELARMKEQKQTPEFMGLSYTSFEDMLNEDGGSVLDILPSPQIDPAEEAAFQSDWNKEVRALSPMARKIADIIKNPPVEFLEELECQYEHSMIAVNMNRADRAVKPFITLRSVSDFLTALTGCDRETMILAEAELINAAIRVNQHGTI